MKRTLDGAKTTSGWIAPSFGDFNNGMQLSRVISSQKKVQLKHNNFHMKEANIGSTSELPWLEYFTPSNESELAVHKKKVQEVKDWFTTSISQRQSNILLLTGPCGCGKSSVIRVLAKSLHCELKEWINPVSDHYQERTENSWASFDTLYESQNQKFTDFLLRANRYNSLNIDTSADTAFHQRKIVVVEDLPNFAIRDPAKLHAILRQYQQTGRSPLVFIMSDNHDGSTSVHSLFPNSLQQELPITHISFNAVATTHLKSLVNNMLKAKSEKENSIVKPSKDTIDLLIASSNGDIRSCINLVQFYCTNTNPQEPFLKEKTKRKAKEVSAKKSSKKVGNENFLLNVGRDQSLFLFRSLGKVLYCKRTSTREEDTQLPSHLKHCAREKLNENPEDVFERTQVDADTFLLYLHQNYPSFYSNIDDVCNGSEYVSDADIMSSCWNPQANLSNYCSSVGIRGIMFANSSSSSKVSGWRPIHKPEYFQTYKTINRRSYIAKDIFKEEERCSRVIYCEKIPYLGRMLSASYSGYQSFFKEMLTLGNQSSRLQQLSDTVESSFSYDSNDTAWYVNNSSNNKEVDSFVDEEEDENIIEDFRD